ncbi:serine/threonine-protein kinase SMG1-like isoform X1 [Punica granatum]|uniref:non-specific serine/threonine protein kinase n=1 Tax=Punica granatum TaxID=22663 RepID=A0A6P8C8J8_PUNGR|nr:serine/threonine-protein kinase SMG1-like isoform X1 [Punica granatum]
MQGLHHQQQQLAALLSAALPKDSIDLPSSASSSSSSSSTSKLAAVPSSASADTDDSARLAAISSLHRAILYPPNSLLVAHSASFLSQGLSQLLSDQSYSVRQAAATAYGALCAVVCSIPITSNTRQNHVILGAMVDRFISWALPLLNNVGAGDRTAELALDSLREFLNVGDVNGIERYSLPILKACQQLLEDERTSLSLLHRLLGVLTLVSLKFMRCFQPHFLDIVDLLLGWALVPDLSDSDRRVIMDCFLQFQKHWVANLQFSLGLLLKFLGDMETLLQDGGLGTAQQFRRLLALLSCFTAVLQSTASGLLELNLLEQISEPLSKMLPRFLASLSIVGRRFGWSKWYGDLWRCLTLLAEILREKFAAFYPLAVDTLFQSLEMTDDASPSLRGKVSSVHVHGVLKTNLQLLSLQKLGLLPSSVQKILHFNSSVSRLRLHPNHVVTASSAATYVFLLQHSNQEVVDQAVALLLVELRILRSMVEKAFTHGDEIYYSDSKSYSKLELCALVKFDLKVLLTCVVLDGIEALISQPDIAILYLKRSDTLIHFIFENLHPFDSLIMASVELQVTVFGTLERLSKVEFLSKYVTCEEKALDTSYRVLHSTLIGEHGRKYSRLLVKALHASSPLAVKLEALKWIQRFCEDVINLAKHSEADPYHFKSFLHTGALWNIIVSVLDAASDKEQKVRSHVTLVLELLLRARLVYGMSLYPIAHRVLEKLGDPDNNIRNTFVGLLSNVLPAMVYSCGLCEYGTSLACGPYSFETNSSVLHWKQLFSLRQLPQRLQAQQLVSVLSYISQRWKVPLSSWIQRLIHSCRKSDDLLPTQSEDMGDLSASESWLDVKVDEEYLEKVCSSSVLAGAWWAVQEAARYCTSTRLRTNLGGPSQTFAALERMLVDVAHVLPLDSEQNDGSLSIINSSGAHLLPMRLLLDFVEALKKNVYNAYEGSAVLGPVSRASSLFFRANKKVCEEWFSRICEPMMNAGLALQCPYAIIQYCSLRLYDLHSIVSSAFKDKSRGQKSNLEGIRSRFSGDVLRVLRHMTLALCRIHEPEALLGLLTWASQSFYPLFLEDNQSIDHSGISGPFTWINGLVYQAKGQYEGAAAYFTHLLQSEDSLRSMDSDGVQFVIERIIESYSALSDWKSLESWLLELQTLRAKYAGKSYSGALTTAGNEINAIHALSRFDEGDFHAAWACLDLTPKSSGELTLDPKLALQRSEQMLLQALLLQVEGKIDKLPEDLQKAKQMLEENLSVLALDGLEDAAAVATQLHCIAVFEDGLSVEGREERSKQFYSALPSYFQLMQSPISKTRQDCSPWLKVLRVYRTIYPSSPLTLNLCMNLSSLARRQKNLLLAHHLNDYLREHLPRCSEERFCNSLASNLEYERILLAYAENKYEDAFTSLWSFLRPCIVSSASSVSETNESILKARACLKLADWQRDHSVSFFEVIAPMMEEDFNTPFLHVDRDGNFSSDGSLNYKQSAGPIIDEIMGTATKLSTQLCPYMGKAWMSYGSWCFIQARNSILNPHDSVLKSCSFSPLLVSEIQPGRFMLSEDEVENIRAVILQIFLKLGEDCKLNNKKEDQHDRIASSEDLTNNQLFKALIEQVVNILEAAAGAPGAEESSGESLSTTVASRLHKSFLNANVKLEVNELDQLVDIWWTLRKRRVSLFGYAARGFSQYLSCSSSKFCNGQLIGSVSESLKTGCYTLKATLYLLHILLNYGVELLDTLEPSLSAVPLWPWQEIIPQLFARLSSHPEQAVRRQLQNLLMMLGKRSPWSIVYPTLVDVNANQENHLDELQQILGCLRELHPRLIQDVQLMIDELGNVTVLWEELWLSTLQDLHADVMRRIHVLREEAARIAENTTLSQSEKNKINAAKYSAMMAPIIVTLERRLASTSHKPVTPHELWFHQNYMEQLKSAIWSFKTPPKSASALGDVWRPFDAIAASLASYQRKCSVSLGEVAPQLALLSSSDVPMPGLEKEVNDFESDGGLTSSQGIITIASFLEQVVILSTKTKPKKINIMGSDGQKYTYLLKGREDLRLDARIMQLLQAINCLLHSSPATRTHPINIRYYSVTPISGRAGLIQWVHNVISIYSVFKSWQTRAQLAQLSSSATGDTKNVAPSIPRPSDMFYGKIIPALKEKGIKRVISRRDWPQDVKRKVLMDLMKEVPRQLLYQELWCASEGFKAFNSKLKRYSGSVAAMSMVGHILGLGDRHLDNILVDFCSGDIVHIDYNVCFDKGQRLKVPEVVPFRLTHTIEAALGLTGVEGTFRANCEAVMGVLRKNKDILLMLLEVFVWDPLVEWTRGDFHDDAAIGGEERKGMELAVSLSLFSSRVQEIRVPLQEHHDLLLSTLPAVESALERFADVLSKYEHVSALFFRVDQEKNNLILHEASAKSIVAEVTCNSEKIRASFEIHAREYSQAKAMVAEKAKEATTWIEQHGKVLDALQSSSVAELNPWLKLSSMRESLSLTSAVSVAGVPLSVVPEPTQAQCDDIDREVSQVVVDLDHGVASALTAIQVYSLALQRILPLNYRTTSSVNAWAQVLQLFSDVLSSDALSIARRRAAELVSHISTAGHESIKLAHDNLSRTLDKYVLDLEKVEKECSEVMNTVGSETESKAKDHVLSSFMKFMQSGNIEREDETHHDARNQSELSEKEKALLVLNLAVIALYTDVRGRVLGIGNTVGLGSSCDFSSLFGELEGQVEKCNLFSEFLNEVSQSAQSETSKLLVDLDNRDSDEKLPSIFKRNLVSCKFFIDQLIEDVLPDLARATISYNSEVLDMFESIAQLRASTDAALEQLIEVEMERTSLVELEKNYFVKVGLITEKQLALKEASLKGRDHLSWEEAEELASQEDACRVQLDQLHQTWNQRDKRAYYLLKREAEAKNALISTERHFQTLFNAEEGGELHGSRAKALLIALIKPFMGLELTDRVLSSFTNALASSGMTHNLADVRISGHSLSENVWKIGGLVNSHAFFIWKVSVMDSFVDSCIQDIASSLDQNLGYDQLLIVLRKKLAIQLERHISFYLKNHFIPSLVTWLEKEIEQLKQFKGATKELTSEYLRMDPGAVKKVQLMLEEYSKARKTAQAARSAASIMEKQVKELREAICRTGIEIVQMEWMHESQLTPSHNSLIALQKFFSVNDDLRPLIPRLSRSKLLEIIQSAVVRIAQSIDSLQSIERTSLTAQGQLERAMGWACGGPTPTKMSGIPPEFHQHLMRRQQLMWDAREKASDIINICMSVLEFEASRDGILWVPGEVHLSATGSDNRAWQQVYFNALTRLDVAYHSFSRLEQEWKLAKSSMEAASSGLYSATNELCIASLKAKTASDDLQSTILAMRDFAYEASVSLSAFGRVSRTHTALTSECGSMLEEVLAMTDDLHDVYSLGKEAAAMHHSLVDDLSKANAILLPLESVLSKDVATMTDTITRERETKAEISPLRGEAIYRSYSSRIREASQTFNPLLPSLMISVKGLLSLLTRLARTASLHAGNLHKAFEGVGESQREKSQGFDLSKADFDGEGSSSVDGDGGEQSRYDEGDTQDTLGFSGLSLNEKGWISLPDSICTSSSGSESSITEVSVSDGFRDSTEEASQAKLPEFKDPVGPTDGGSDHESPVQISQSLLEENEELKSGAKDETSSRKTRIEDDSDEALSTNKHMNGPVIRGKNTYAMSVLRRVEMKLDGRDISDSGQISIAEQVDYLLKQATSVDNLCNMYEGWTPWI